MPEIIVNGYAYPFISQNTLKRWLPSLTYISSFSYGFTADGILSELDDTAVLSTVYDHGDRSLMVLTPFDENGVFNSHLVTELLNDPAASDALIYSMLETVRRKGMSGVDFDFEFLMPQDRDLYSALVRMTREIFNAEGYIATVALAPKTSANQRGLLYEGHDYGGMGYAADYVLLMTYEWGYKYGPPMAVAPYNQVRRVIEYGLTEIPANKILMGMANYGYDWTLPFVQGESEAETISNPEAVARAARYGAVIRFDESAQSPYYTYTDESGRQHEVWFENGESWRAKFNLIPEFGLAGISIWNIMNDFPEGVAVLSEMFSIRAG